MELGIYYASAMYDHVTRRFQFLQERIGERSLEV